MTDPRDPPEDTSAEQEVQDSGCDDLIKLAHAARQANSNVGTDMMFAAFLAGLIRSTRNENLGQR